MKPERMNARGKLHTTISFSYDKCWACAVNGSLGVRVRLLSQEAKDGAIAEDVELWNDDSGAVDKAIDYLASYPHISRFRLLKRSEDGCVASARITTNPNSCPLYSALGELGQNVIKQGLERVDYCGNIEWDLELKGAKKAEQMRTLLEKRFGIADVKFKKRSVARPMSKSTFLLKEAFERGYFDVPKKISIEELSNQLSVPLSTLNVNIRRALKNVLREGTT